jgi:pimeloyl-ACP methyl ester carboxylesterase
MLHGLLPFSSLPVIERSFVSIPSGRVHLASCGSGRPILLLHQTPRSWDEYRDVLPLLGGKYRAIAMDTVGFGDSHPLPDGQDSIERWAGAAHEVLQALGHGRAVVVGHHTGAAIAVEMAAQQPMMICRTSKALPWTWILGSIAGVMILSWAGWMLYDKMKKRALLKASMPAKTPEPTPASTAAPAARKACS